VRPRRDFGVSLARRSVLGEQTLQILLCPRLQQGQPKQHPGLLRVQVHRRNERKRSCTPRDVEVLEPRAVWTP
jgi:hypothetical protein